MEQQETILNFQKPLEMSSKSSLKSSFAVPNSFQEAEQVLLGSLLGDGCLHINKKNREKNAKFYESHSIKQKSYLLWKKIILQYFLIIKIRDEIKGIYHISNLRSLSNSILNKYHKLFYPNGKKIVTEEILNKLKPLGLAVWYADDGNYSYRSKNIVLSTHNFGYKGNILIINWFKEKYNIKWIMAKSNSKSKYCYFLRLNCNESKKFINLIKPYVQECMNYKLGLDKEKISEAIIKNKGCVSQYYIKNKEKKKSYNQQYYLQNKTNISKQKKEYYINNKEIILRKDKEYYNKKKMLERSNRQALDKGSVPSIEPANDATTTPTPDNLTRIVI